MTKVHFGLFKKDRGLRLEVHGDSYFFYYGTKLIDIVPIREAQGSIIHAKS
mgnify:CR=1 FL=1